MIRRCFCRLGEPPIPQVQKTIAPHLPWDGKWYRICFSNQFSLLYDKTVYLSISTKEEYNPKDGQNEAAVNRKAIITFFFRNGRRRARRIHGRQILSCIELRHLTLILEIFDNHNLFNVRKCGLLDGNRKIFENRKSSRRRNHRGAVDANPVGVAVKKPILFRLESNR